MDTQYTDCCIVGGGPAGVVLAFLLARAGINVKLLEAHRDFDRDFRGDTIQPSTMEIIEELGLAEKLLQIPHSKARKIALRSTNTESFFSFDFSFLKTRHPYIVIMPQVRFLEFMVEEAKHYANFQLVLGANVQELIEEDGIIKGVRYRTQGDWQEIRARVIIGADGRHSKVRELAGLTTETTSPPMDVLWFRLPRLPEDGEGLNGRVGNGRLMAMLDRGECWQIAYIFPKGTYQQIRADGLEALRNNILELIPEFFGRVEQLQNWHDIAFLSVESSFVTTWYRQGLLLIGDAAHVMSPVGGVGINYAIQDAVEAANILSQPLKARQIEIKHLRQVQKKRALPTRFIQAFQALIQQRLIKAAFEQDKPFNPPFFLKIPLLRQIPARLIAFGIFSARVRV